MFWWEILIITIIAVFVVGTITVSIARKKQGRSSSCGDCACCSYRNNCKTDK